MKTYRINVSRDTGKRQFNDKNEILYQYYFHVELDTKFTFERAMEVAADMRKRYPLKDGFSVHMTEWTVPVGNDIEIKAEINAEIKIKSKKINWREIK
jgi:hypothetical protein